MRTLAKSFILIFVLGLAAFGAFLQLKSQSHFAALSDQRDPKLISELNPEYLATNVLNPNQAKQEHFFWANKQLPSGGGAIRILENADLFSQIFPGYPKSMREDRPLWDLFFSQSMFLLDWIFFPGEKRNDLLIAHSDFGGVEIFKHYGADILIFGNSESEAISPAVLNARLNGNPKVLGVEVPASTLKVTRQVAEYMAHADKHSHWAVLGVPLSNLFFHSESTLKNERSILARFSSFQSESDGSVSRYLDTIQSWRLDRLFSLVSWDDFGSSQAGKTYINGQVFPVSWMKEGSDSEKKLDSFSSHTHFQSDLFSSIQTQDCQMLEADEELSSTLDSVSKLADQTLVILTPASLLELSQLPSCFIQNAQALLKSKAKSNVSVLLASDADYGMTLADYVAIDAKGQMAYLDQNHLNSHGVRLFSEGVAKFLESHGGHP